MIRVERLVVPEPKSCCSTSSVRRRLRAHSRAIATPLIPPPIMTTSKCAPSREARRLRLGSTCRLDAPPASFRRPWPARSPGPRWLSWPRSDRLDRVSTTGDRFTRAVAIMARLRGPGGCPWDREQTFDTIKPYTLEETYEVLEAIDHRDWDELPGELGDLLLQVLFYAQMAQEEGRFSIDVVLDRLSDKPVDRHPHVFGDVKAETSGDVLRNWEALKAEEKKKRLAAGGGKAEKPREQPESVLAGISTAMPALLEAHKLSSRAAHVGFDWPNIAGLFDKLAEETRELQDELARIPPPGPHPQNRGVA